MTHWRKHTQQNVPKLMTVLNLGRPVIMFDRVGAKDTALLACLSNERAGVGNRRFTARRRARVEVDLTS